MARTVDSMPRRARLAPAVAALGSAVLVTGCSGVGVGSADEAVRTGTTSAPSVSDHRPDRGAGDDSRTSSDVPPTPARKRSDEPDTAAGPSAAREPRRSYLTIPALGLRRVPVVRYVGRPDDAAGTRIQDRGPTASPRGRRGGVGPGEVGNFIITGHRTSHTAPFRDLPALGVGHVVRVRSAGTVSVYRIRGTRWTSFRSPRSRAEQTAAVPGRPHARPVRPMITLSTCATPEDHANGNYWSDRFGNPEHRIDKIGVLVRQERAGA